MPQTPITEVDLKGYSCLTCRQRKVKCDRHTPSCSNCIIAERQCSFVPPVRGKRKRTKPPKEGLHAKLRRYEELLKSYGVKIDPTEDGDDSEVEAVSQPDVDMTEDVEPRSRSHLSKVGNVKPKLVTKDGSSRYFDRYVCLVFGPYRNSANFRSGLWSNLGEGVSLSFPLSRQMTVFFLTLDSSTTQKKTRSLSSLISQILTIMTS
jgi:hypothetical protein